MAAAIVVRVHHGSEMRSDIGVESTQVSDATYACVVDQHSCYKSDRERLFCCCGAYQRSLFFRKVRGFVFNNCASSFKNDSGATATCWYGRRYPKGMMPRVADACVRGRMIGLVLCLCVTLFSEIQPCFAQDEAYRKGEPALGTFIRYGSTVPGLPCPRRYEFQTIVPYVGLPNPALAGPNIDPSRVVSVIRETDVVVDETSCSGVSELFIEDGSESQPNVTFLIGSLRKPPFVCRSSSNLTVEKFWWIDPQHESASRIDFQRAGIVDATFGEIMLIAFAWKTTRDASTSEVIPMCIYRDLRRVEKGVQDTGSTETSFGNQDGTAVSQPQRRSFEELNACFPADAMVDVEGVGPVRMEDVEIGQRIRTGHEKYSEVFMFTHREAYVRSSFVRIETSHDRRVTLSHGHYVPVYRRRNGGPTSQTCSQSSQMRARNSGLMNRDCQASDDGDFELVPAALLTDADVVALANGTLSAVRRVEQTGVSGRGLYNPQTLDGGIVVNGVVMSTYTTAVHPWAADWLLAPIRLLYARSGVVVRYWESTSWLHSVPKMLDRVVSLGGHAHSKYGSGLRVA